MDHIRYSKLITIFFLELPKFNIKVHLFASRIGAYVNSFIIEMPQSLILIDTQQSYDLGKEFKEYALTLNKPIKKVILTHEHWDHYMGMSNFQEFPTFALKESIEVMKQNPKIDKTLIPKNPLENNFALEGFNFECFNIKNAHAKNNLILYLKEAKLLIVGDLLQENGHLLIKDFNCYISQMEEIQHKLEVQNILTGHWKITDKNTLLENISYVKECKKIANIASSKEIYDKMVREKFPKRNKLNRTLALLLDNKYYQGVN